MNRIIAWAVAALLVPCLLAPPASAARLEARVYLLGVGVLDPPLCGGPTSTNLLSVCFVLTPGDSDVSFHVKEDLGGQVVAKAYFVDSAGAAVGSETFFCTFSPTLAVPAGAVAARVVLGPLPEVAEIPGCLASVATSGRVIASFA